MRLRGLSDRTIRARRATLIRTARHLGADPLSATGDMVAAWQSARSRQITSTSLYSELAHLLGYVRWGVDRDLTDGQAMRRIVTPKLPRRIPRPAPETELLTALVAAVPDVRLMLVLATFAGLRAMEIAGLDRADILDSADPPVMMIRGKGKRDRLVPISPDVMAEMRLYRLPLSGPVFPRRDGMPGHMLPARVSALVAEHLQDQGMRFTLHQCRHLFGTSLYRDSRDLRMVQEMLGHSSPTTTAGYAAYAPSDAVRAINRLGRRLPSRIADSA